MFSSHFKLSNCREESCWLHSEYFDMYTNVSTTMTIFQQHSRSTTNRYALSNHPGLFQSRFVTGGFAVSRLWELRLQQRRVCGGTHKCSNVKAMWHTRRNKLEVKCLFLHRVGGFLSVGGKDRDPRFNEGALARTNKIENFDKGYEIRDATVQTRS